MSAALDLTDPIFTPVPNLPNHQLDGEVSIDSYDNKTFYSIYFGGMYCDSICVYCVYYSSLPLYVGNGKNHRQYFHYPTIVYNEIEVDDDELIIKLHREAIARK